MLPVPSFLNVTKPKGLRTPDQLHGYQNRAVHHQCSMPNTMMWLDVGLGKTAVTLTSIAHLINTGVLRGVIIVAPIRVCKLVWRQEAAKWAHTNHLTFSMVTGDKDLRSRALLRPADVYLINYDNLKWLATFLHTHFISKGKQIPFNGLVWDEISKCKNSSTDRVKAFLKIEDHFDWTTGLTGTPASNGYKDLHGQYLVVDKGQRLGRGKTKFKTAFYHKEGPYVEVPFADTESRIKALISDITLEMSAADYNPLPDMIVNDVEVDFEPKEREQYEQFEKDMFMRLDSGEEIEAFNKAALMNKCLQYSQGSVYPLAGVPVWVSIHDLKLDALEDIIEESQGSPILCAYSYRSDAERIMKRFAHLNPINLTECKSDRALNEAMARWKSGKCPLMIGHPQSMGHGVDGLQDAGHIIVWFGLTWSLDLYVQLNGRIRRQGQGKPVMCHRIMVTKTLDQVQAIALNGKADVETDLRNAIKQYRLEKGV